MSTEYTLTETDKSTDSESSCQKLSELESLIHILKRGIKKNEPGIQVIKYPNLLVDALEELNNLVGMDRLKESIALMTLNLIENLKDGKKSKAMLNTVLFGPAGVGKTSAGKILAKIWFALGYLENSSKTTIKKSYTTEIPGSVSKADIFKVILLLLAWGGTYILQFISFTYKRLGLYWFSLLLAFIIFILLLFWAFNDNEYINKYFYEKYTEKEIRNADDKDIIKIVSRDDFVAGYLGQTAGKTKKLLEENTGKVLFIDEAYSLLNDVRDAYGMEALTTLNQYLSENPDKIVVILAGYKLQMKAGIFAAQPGLPRRCMWKFNCDPYSGEELADIFFIQAEKSGWKFYSQDKDRIVRLISKNEKLFKSYGGDTERLVYLSGLEATRKKLRVEESFLSSVSNKSSETSNYLTYDNVNEGLIRLKENDF